MKVSVIIPTLPKNQKYLDLCAQSLIRNTTAFEIELLIAENGEGTPYEQGQCKAVNREAKRATGDWIMVVNDDMYFPKTWDALADFDLSLCWSPNLIEPVQIGSAPPFLKLDGGDSLDNFKPEVVDALVTDYESSEPEKGFNLPFLMRRDLWEVVEGYDEYYDPWGSNSDTDLQMKVELAGVTPVRNRNCLVYHFGSKSETFTPDKQDFWWQNWHYLEAKWGFNRDDAKSDTWYCKDMIMKEKLIYHPGWEGIYGL